MHKGPAPPASQDEGRQDKWATIHLCSRRAGDEEEAVTGEGGGGGGGGAGGRGRGGGGEVG